MSKDYCVIGIGNLGREVVKNLVSLNKNVMAIDKNESRIRRVSHLVFSSFVIDATRPFDLEKTGIRNFENVFIALESNIKDSVLISGILSSWRIRYITVKVFDDFQEYILKKLGLKKLILLEKTEGKKIAWKLTLNLPSNFFLISQKDCLSLISIPFFKKGVFELFKDKIEQDFEVKILAIFRKEKIISLKNDKLFLLKEGDLIVCYGTIINTSNLKNFFDQVKGAQ